MHTVSHSISIYSSKGFTLIELLVTLSIIGILTMTLVPQFSEYRKKAFDYRAQSDLRSVAIAEEAFFIDNEEYLSCSNQSCTQLPGIKRISNGVELTINGTDESFTGTATHTKGSGKVWTWDSSQGGFINDSN
jgi:prepilin-type N-terminal cleavage/methylation domain-containing protein